MNNYKLKHSKTLNVHFFFTQNKDIIEQPVADCSSTSWTNSHTKYLPAASICKLSCTLIAKSLCS